MKLKGWIAFVTWTAATVAAVSAQTKNVENLHLAPKWNVRDTLTNCAALTGLAVKFAPGATLERFTRDVLSDHASCGAMVNFRRVAAQDALAWILHMADLSATLSKQTLTVMPSGGTRRVPKNLAIKPEPVDIAEFLGPTAGARTIGLTSRNKWDTVQLFAFLCLRADVPNYVIAPSDLGNRRGSITVGPINFVPVADVMTNVLAEAGYEALVFHETLFLRPRQPDTGELP